MEDNLNMADINSFILEDFITFCEYLIDNEINLTATSQNLKRNDLFKLNKLMNYQNNGVSQNSDQKSYPLIHLFYILAVEGELFYITGTVSQTRFDLNKERYN